jgi:hypothetical protein
MEASSKMEFATKIIGPVITITGILIGVMQFNSGQKVLQQKELEQRQFELKKMQVGNQLEALTMFKEIQSAKYKEATETISNIIYSDNYQSAEFKKTLKRFWQLYWVELSAVEDQQVERAMKPLGDFIASLEKRNFKNISEEEKNELFTLGYTVAQAIKKSSKSWELPAGLEK